MKIERCGSCGVCAEMILSGEFKCPSDAFSVPMGSYPNAVISKDCTDCGKCLLEIKCLCEAIRK